jgi:hypothetical protein
MTDLTASHVLAYRNSRVDHVASDVSTMWHLTCDPYRISCVTIPHLTCEPTREMRSKQGYKSTDIKAQMVFRSVFSGLLLQHSRAASCAATRRGLVPAVALVEETDKSKNSKATVANHKESR